ncbi:MAG: N-acetyltransferase [Caulobacteraceae bacterium]
MPPIGPEEAADADAVEALIDRAFGPGRHAKAAERLREGRRPIPGLSLVARADGTVVGCARLWAIAIGEAPAVLLGPFAVEAAFRARGLGAALIGAACDAAQRGGHGLVLLVGDESYFAPLGFAAEPARGVIMPGPVDRRRVLVRALRPGAAEGLAGAVRPAASLPRASLRHG